LPKGIEKGKILRTAKRVAVKMAASNGVKDKLAMAGKVFLLDENTFYPLLQNQKKIHLHFCGYSMRNFSVNN